MTQKDYKLQVRHYIKNIQKASDENHLSLFAGAGVSLNSNLPSYKVLIEYIQKQLKTKENDYRILAEMFYNQYGENYYYQTLKQLIPSDCNPNDLHTMIVQLNLKNLITTNWDNLFEKAIVNAGRYYDIISSDEDIARNRGFAKFIKMHGSLDRENIIFTDSDYLAYSDKFPLIENYIKSVFSTDIVVIMGYSLNDGNVKQIISWVNSKTTNIKPIYFIKKDKSFDFKEFEFYKKKNIYIIYWDNGLDSFLRKIGNEVDIDKLSIRDICERFEKLKQITDRYQYKYITPTSFVEMVVNLFGLWGGYNDIIYTAHIGIEIHNKKLIKIYNKLILKNKSMIDSYFSHFANIVNASIFIGSNEKVAEKSMNTAIDTYFVDFDYKNLENRIKSIINSVRQDDENELKKAFLFYQNRQFIESYHILKQLSNSAFKHKNYIVWFICEFNKIHFVFDNPFDDDYKKRKKEIETYFKEIRKINLQDLLLRLPKTDRETLKPLVDIESLLDKSLIKVIELCNKIQKDYSIYKGGGFSLNNNVNQVLYIFSQIQLLVARYQLTLEYNRIIIDFYTKALESLLISFGIAQIREEKNQKTQTQIIEIPFNTNIYSHIIRFYDYKELAHILNTYFNERVLFTFQDYEFITNLLYNICDKFDKQQSYYINRFNAFLRLNAYIQLPQNIFDAILYIFNEKMQGGLIGLNEYDSINSFIVNQYKRNKKLNFDTIQETIKTYIDSFICGKINFYHIVSLTHSPMFENMFSILKDCHIKKERIDIFLRQICYLDIKIQGIIATRFLVGLYTLSHKNKNIQKEIKEFLNSLISAYKTKKDDKKIQDSDYFTLCYLAIEKQIISIKKENINIEMENYKKNADMTDMHNIGDTMQTLEIIKYIQNEWKQSTPSN